MQTRGNKRFRVALVLTTLALCALFLAEGGTAVLGARVLQSTPASEHPLRRSKGARPFAITRHDPAVILRRNIFDSDLGDLTQITVTGGEIVDGDVIVENGESVNRCNSRLKLAGTAVIPGDLGRSLAVIVGSDSETTLYQGGAEVEGSRILAIHADGVYLQAGSGGLCRLPMFAPEAEGPAGPPKPPPPTVAKKRRSRRVPGLDRNAGLSSEEIAHGIEKVSDTAFNVERSLLNKVLDNAGKLIGIAAVSPKMEDGKSVGMEIRGIRRNTLLTKLGIKNNDLLESVNGQPLSSPDTALGAYTTLRTADKFTLSIVRDGKPIVINYTLN